MRNEFFAELSQIPEWLKIIEEIKSVKPQRTNYNPNDAKKTADEQADRWKFVSGQENIFDRICKILNIEV